MTQSLLRALPVLAFVGLASCYPFSHEPPGGGYVKFAELAYRSYDHNGKLIATIYMVPEKDLEEHLKIVSDEKTRRPL